MAPPDVGASGAIPRVIATGKLHIGDFVLDVYVLEDGRRIFDAEQVHRLLGLSDEQMADFYQRVARSAPKET